MKRTPHNAALQTITGETGCSALIIVLLATGIGLLLDFQLLDLHPVFSTALLLLGVPIGLYWAIRRTMKMNQKDQRGDYIRNMALAAVAGQAGCATVIMIFMALFAGVFLDSRLNTHPVFTLVLVLLSIPVSLYIMVRMVLSTTSRITPSTTDKLHSSAAQRSKENGP